MPSLNYLKKHLCLPVFPLSGNPEFREDHLCAVREGNDKGTGFLLCIRSFFPFPCEHPKTQEHGCVQTCQDEPGQQWHHCLPASPLVEPQLVIHNAGPTKLKHLCPPRATLEMAASRTGKSQPRLAWAEKPGRHTLTFYFKLTSLCEGQALVKVDGGHPVYQHQRGKPEPSSVGTHFHVVSVISDL